MMITEYMQGGDLRKALDDDSSSPRQLGWYGKGRSIAFGLAQSLAYLHSQSVCAIPISCCIRNILIVHACLCPQCGEERPLHIL